MGKRASGRSRIRWDDYISDRFCSRLGVEPAKLSKITSYHEVFGILQVYTDPRIYPEKKLS